jgi:hypothetical protein
MVQGRDNLPETPHFLVVPAQVGIHGCGGSRPPLGK